MIICAVCQFEMPEVCVEDVFTSANCHNCSSYWVQFYGFSPQSESVYFDEFEITNYFDKDQAWIVKLCEMKTKDGIQSTYQEVLLETDYFDFHKEAQNFEEFKDKIRFMVTFS